MGELLARSTDLTKIFLAQGLVEVLRVSEVYRSVQGEGPRVGLPTTFVRFAGCNLRCPGWPCDTPHAIFPKEYRHEWQTVSDLDLEMLIFERSMPGENVCLTGGEVWLQNHDELQKIVRSLVMGDRHVECFTNGTLQIPGWALANMKFVFDWKLPGSGEATDDARVTHNIHTARDNAAVKFTIADWDDFQEAVKRESELQTESGLRQLIPIYVGPVWGKIEPSQIVKWMLETDLVHWRLNLQTHKYMWQPDERKR